jgi:hypothetical protein
MVVKTTSGQIVSAHWNDRFYEATCPECGEDVFGDNLGELGEMLDCHC